MKTTYLNVLLICSVLFSAGAIAKPINPGDYEQVPTDFRGENKDKARKVLLKKVKQAQAGQSRAQIVVMPFSDKDVPGADKIGAAKAAERTLKAQLRNSGVEIVDRDIPKALQEELLAIEQSGESLGSSYELADFAFNGEVLDVAFTQKFSPAESKRNSDGGWYTEPAKCRVNAAVTVSLSFYNMNPLSLQKTLVLKDKSSSTFEAGNYYRYFTSCRHESVNYGAVAVDAIKKTIDKKVGTIQNLFAAEGWVIEHRAKKKNHIFKTTFKSTTGTKPGTKVKIFKKVKITDPLTQKVQEVKSEVAEGKVVEVYGDTNVWIKVKKKVAADILLGDLVEVLETDKCGFDIKCLKNRVM